MRIERKTSPHFRKGRAGYKPTHIVIHISDGNLESLDNTFANPLSKVSSHYGIGKKAQIHQYVDEKDTAFHAGIIRNPTAAVVIKNRSLNPNYYTIGIEHEGKATDAWPQEQFFASAQLIAEIAARWSIPIDADHVIPHRAIRADKSCPGFVVDLVKLIELAKQFAKEAPAGIPAPGERASGIDSTA